MAYNFKKRKRKGKPKTLERRVLHKGQKIHGYNRLRDGRICVLADRYGWTTQEIAKKFNLTQTRIEQILRTNKVLVPIDRQYEGKKRIRALLQEIRKKTEKGENSRKDILDVYDQLRKELEGEKPAVQINQNYVQIYRPEKYSREELETAPRSADRSV